MTKRILAILLIILSVLSFSAAAFAAESNIKCSEISFVDGNGSTVTALSAVPITAKVTVTENSSGKKPVLLVCSYEKDMLNGMWYSVAEALTGELKVTFTPVTISADTVIEATVVDGIKSFAGKSVSAKLLADTTSLKRITVNGKIIESYSDDTDAYMYQVSGTGSIDIAAVPADGGTKIEITDADSIPGIANIKLTSQQGNTRSIDLVLYSDIAQLTAPTKLKYKIGENSYEISGFDANTKEYTVELPENTFYVTVEPEVLSVAEAKVRVQDTNHLAKTYDGISYVPGYDSSISYSYTSALKPRISINNVVPVKNEETLALIDVTYGDTTETYTVKFKAKQPRLKAFNVTGGANDKYKPIFVSGAAVNNDNGTTTGPDRATWSLGNVSENLVGGSMFAMSMGQNTSTGTFVKDNTSGEYFNFTADTPGTVYFLTYVGITNSQWAIKEGTDDTEYTWEQVAPLSGVTANGLLPSGYTDWKSAPKTYNSFGDGVYFSNVCLWSGEDVTVDRYTAGGLDGTVPASGGIASLIYVYKRDFAKDENVSIYHTGNNSTNPMCRYMQAIIVWDID